MHNGFAIQYDILLYNFIFLKQKLRSINFSNCLNLVNSEVSCFIAESWPILRILKEFEFFGCQKYTRTISSIILIIIVIIVHFQIVLKMFWQCYQWFLDVRCTLTIKWIKNTGNTVLKLVEDDDPEAITKAVHKTAFNLAPRLNLICEINFAKNCKK